MTQQAPVPTRQTFTPLLKQALESGRPFAYRPSEECTRPFFVPLDNVVVVLEVLEWVEESYREDFLDLVPKEMTRLLLTCLEIKTDPFSHHHKLRYRETTATPAMQLELQLEDKNFEHATFRHKA